MKRATKVNITKAILGVIGLTGLIAMAAVAPNALQLLSVFQKRHYRYYVSNRLIQLKNKGLITFVVKNNKTYIRLTEKGKAKLRQYKYKEMVIPKPRKWDGKWRMLIFDIKETRKPVRDQLREQLINLRLVKVQQSVWIHPYDFSEIIILLKADFSIGKDVLCLTVEKLENDGWLKTKFGLR